MEIGSFIELQLPQEGEWFVSVSDRSIARLNSGRAAIYYALLLTQCEEIWVPYYQCESVKTFLLKKHISSSVSGKRQSNIEFFFFISFLKFLSILK